MPLPSRQNKVIGIVGSRRRNTANDMVLCTAAFDRLYKKGDSIVSGGCPKGADNFTEYIARGRGIPIFSSWEDAFLCSVGERPNCGEMVIHYPDFATYGSPQAYFARNSLIAQDCDVLIALVAEDRTGGTEDTVRKAMALRKRVYIILGADSPLFHG